MSAPHEGSSSNRASWRTAVALVVGAAAIGGVGVLLWWWVNASDPLLLDRPHDDLYLTLQYHDHGAEGRHLHRLPQSHPLPLVIADASLTLFGRSYAGLMLGQILLAAATMALLAGLAYSLAGPIAAMLTALFAAGMPLLLCGALTYDDHLTHILGATIAILLLRYSDGLRRPLPALVAGLLAGRLLADGFYPSLGFMAAASIALAAIGLAFETWIIDRSGPPIFERSTAVGQRVRRSLPYLGAATALGVGFLIGAHRQGGYGYFAYIFQGAAAPEFGVVSPWREPLSLLGIPAMIVEYHWGVPLALATLAGLASLFIRRVPKRYMLALWLLGLIVVASFSPKKNSFYTFSAAVAAAPIAGIGLSAWRGKIRSIVLGAACLLALAGIGRAAYGLTQKPIGPARGELAIRYLQNSPDVVLRPPDRYRDWTKDAAPALVKTVLCNTPSDAEAQVGIVGTNAGLGLFRFRACLAAPNLRFVPIEYAPADADFSATYWVSPRELPTPNIPPLSDLFAFHVRTVASNLDYAPDLAQREATLRRLSELAQGAAPLLVTPHMAVYAPLPDADFHHEN